MKKEKKRRIRVKKTFHSANLNFRQFSLPILAKIDPLDHLGVKGIDFRNSSLTLLDCIFYEGKLKNT